LLVLPGLFAMARTATSRRGRHWTLGTSIATVFLMWEEFFRFNMERVIAALGMVTPSAATLRLFFWIGREILWWWVIAILLAVIFEFLRRSAVVREAMSWFRPVSGRALARLTGK